LDDDLAAVRFCTSWFTPEENVRQLLEDIRRICKR
jgi:threonine aldolase